MTASPQDVLSFWFGELDDQGLAASEKKTQWFKKSLDFDREITEKFGDVHTGLMAGQNAGWESSPQSEVAGVVVLDQFSRNMFRETSGMFASDAIALSKSKAAIAKGMLSELPPAMQVFLIMPFMHAESLADQETAVDLFTTLTDETTGAVSEAFSANKKYAILHRDIIARFGRFPHRNKLLGRETTPEEEAFLKTPGSSF